MDEFFDVIPGGRWTIAALGLLAIPGVRWQLRPVAKAVVRAGLAVTDKTKEMVAEAREQTSDLVAEVRAEREAPTNNGSEADGEGARRPRRRAAHEPAASA